ncbi:DUF3606 domain-containing protein [Rhodopseudomonas palustris]|uniref:DUF3606 domain-containing protein n=1 Tax=Rhodopseudomonas palustris TaxID=1076 RepID=UPI002ACD24E7|nr:DUF3606 domain-containing protein [Rhodopseudomonas palustris]WQG97870.1 DUF3606 domain-containing protein [Rhodopseudomonas palustris]
MGDDKTIRGPADRARVNVHEDYEVKYWTQKFGVSADQLRRAVKAVGPMARDVARYLGKPL